MNHDLAGHWFISFGEIESWIPAWIDSKDMNFSELGFEKGLTGGQKL